LEIKEIEQLVDDYGKAVYGFCRKIAINSYDADDLYQQTFLKALQVAHKIHKNENPKAYLISLSISIWKNQIRKEVRHQTIAPTTAITDENSEFIASDFDVENAVISNELKLKVNIALNMLEDKFRLPLLLYYTADMPLESIAKAMRCPIGTIKSRLYKGRILVKEKLEGIL
jgi:RNA polymerase sigma-70 factor (ECF subfamily)